MLPPFALALIGLLLGAWTLGAIWAILAARARARRTEMARRHGRRLARMVDESPALPLLVRADGKIEAPPRLAQWLGLEGVPQYLSELHATSASGDETGLPAAQLTELTEAVRRAQRTATPFRMTAVPLGSRRSLAILPRWSA